MRKTVWYVYDGKFKTEVVYYHFGKNQQFPPWYLKEGDFYTIEMKWNLKTNKFWSCLFHTCIMIDMEGK